MNIAILLVLVGGLMNGSFAIPTRFLKRLDIEYIWIFHSLIGLVGIAWILFFIMMPHQISHYKSLSLLSLLWMLGGGFIFGLGQLTFARAINDIGIALSFSINLGLSVIIGSLFTLILKKDFFSGHGIVVLIATLLITVGLVYYYLSFKTKSERQQTDLLTRGCLLAVFAGMASGLQNITFMIVSFHSASSFPIHNSYWFWPPFFSVAAISMILGFKYQLNKKSKYFLIPTFRETGWLIIMGLLFTGSIALYSLAMSHSTHIGKVIGWPLFMVSIILTSQLWGTKYKEIHFKNKLVKWRISLSVVLMLTAIVLLATQN